MGSGAFRRACRPLQPTGRSDVRDAEPDPRRAPGEPVAWATVTIDDHGLAAATATAAGALLLQIRAELADADVSVRKDEGDRRAHEMLMQELAAARPDDAVLSEEGKDDLSRLSAARVWICASVRRSL